MKGAQGEGGEGKETMKRATQNQAKGRIAKPGVGGNGKFTEAELCRLGDEAQETCRACGKSRPWGMFLNREQTARIGICRDCQGAKRVRRKAKPAQRKLLEREKLARRREPKSAVVDAPSTEHLAAPTIDGNGCQD